MKVAHAAGQYQSLMDMAELYPYWRYCTQDDERVRGSHKALDNKVFRYDDPFWDTHYPPNGWNCRCYVRAMDEDDLEDEGLSVTDSRTLKRSGFVGTDSGRVQTAYDVDGTTVPTEDGWNYNPGRIGEQLDQVVETKTSGYEAQLAEQVRNDTDHYEAREEQKRVTVQVQAKSKEGFMPVARSKPVLRGGPLASPNPLERNKFVDRDNGVSLDLRQTNERVTIDNNTLLSIEKDTDKHEASMPNALSHVYRGMRGGMRADENQDSQAVQISQAILGNRNSNVDDFTPLQRLVSLDGHEPENKR